MTGIRMTERSDRSTCVTDDLTHVAAVLPFVVNVTVCPAREDRPPIADISTHYGDDHRMGHGFTTDNPDDLDRASLVLHEAAIRLRIFQARANQDAS